VRFAHEWRGRLCSNLVVVDGRLLTETSTVCLKVLQVNSQSAVILALVYAVFSNSGGSVGSVRLQSSIAVLRQRHPEGVGTWLWLLLH
jgi:hypothetical protein